MDREKQTEYVTHLQLQLTKEAIEKDYRQEDSKIIADLKRVDIEVDGVSRELSGMKVAMQNTEKYTKELVDLQREKNKEERETHTKMFDRIDKHSEMISTHDSWIKNSRESTEKKDAKIKWIVGSIITIVSAIFGFLKIIAPMLFN